MAAFSKGGTTSPDLYIGITCIFLVLLNTVLNSLAFWHNYKKKSSVARSLYLILAVADLATAWVLLAATSVHILEKCNPEVDEYCGDESYFGRIRNASTGLNVYTVVSWTMSLSPANITAFLAFTRFLQIRYPLRPLHLKYWVSGLLLTIVWLPVVVGCAMLDLGGGKECGFPKRLNVLYQSWIYCPRVFGIRLRSRSNYLLMTSVSAFLQVGAIIVSILTIFELVKVYLNPVSEGTRRAEHKTKSSVKILLTNLGSVLFVIFMITTATKSKGNQDDVDANGITLAEGILYLIIGSFIPSLISTLNPIIYIILTPKCSFKFFFPNYS